MFERQSLNEQNNKHVRRNILFELGAHLFGLTKCKTSLNLTCDDYIFFANCLVMLAGFCTVGHANIRLVIKRTLSDYCFLLVIANQGFIHSVICDRIDL